MATTANITRGADLNVGGTFGKLAQRWAQYRTYRRTLAELSELSARDLADLGIHRGSIRALAFEAAYGSN